VYLSCRGMCVTASYCAGKNAAENAVMCVTLDRANVSGMFRSRSNTFKKKT
jgi:hypothetical protein